eukprot:s1692_g2.t2
MKAAQKAWKENWEVLLAISEAGDGIIDRLFEWKAWLPCQKDMKAWSASVKGCHASALLKATSTSPRPDS